MIKIINENLDELDDLDDIDNEYMSFEEFIESDQLEDSLGEPIVYCEKFANGYTIFTRSRAKYYIAPCPHPEIRSQTCEYINIGSQDYSIQRERAGNPHARDIIKRLKNKGIIENENDYDCSHTTFFLYGLEYYQVQRFDELSNKYIISDYDNVYETIGMLSNKSPKNEEDNIINIQLNIDGKDLYCWGIGE